MIISRTGQSWRCPCKP